MAYVKRERDIAFSHVKKIYLTVSKNFWISFEFLLKFWMHSKEFKSWLFLKHASYMCVCLYNIESSDGSTYHIDS